MDSFDEIGNWEIHKTLGSGAFSKVKLGRHKDNNQFAAIKIMKRGNHVSQSFKDLVKNEIDTLKNLEHANLIRLIEFDDNATYKKADGTEQNIFYMALELCTGGELFDFIAQTGRFSEPVARYYFKQMLEGLNYMHNQGISHRDIKPENVLMDDQFNLKIADFGFASHQALNESRRGTESYMAPEISANETYSGCNVDLFATGIILFIMICQHPPFA